MNKQDVVEKAEEIVKGKLHILNQQIQSLKEDLKGETKSSMGDKYETSRAQLHLEIEKLEKQLQLVQHQLMQIQTIDFNRDYKKVENGAFVISSTYNFLIGVGLGEIPNEVEKIYFISLKSPIGQAMKGKQEGEEVSFKNNSFHIEKIV